MNTPFRLKRSIVLFEVISTTNKLKPTLIEIYCTHKYTHSHTSSYRNYTEIQLYSFYCGYKLHANINVYCTFNYFISAKSKSYTVAGILFLLTE